MAPPCLTYPSTAVKPSSLFPPARKLAPPTVSSMKAIFWIGKSGLLGSAIRAFKHRGVSHVELLFSDGMAGTSDREKGGVVLYHLGDPDPADWITIEIPGILPDEERRIRAFIEGELGCPYDMMGIIFAQVFPWHRESPTAWFCSELVVAALKTVLPGLFPKRPCDYDPAAVLLILTERTKQWGL